MSKFCYFENEAKPGISEYRIELVLQIGIAYAKMTKEPITLYVRFYEIISCVDLTQKETMQ